MSTTAYMESIQQKADRLHLEAGDEGDPAKYRKAEELYREIGDDQQADACSEAARKLGG